MGESTIVDGTIDDTGEIKTALGTFRGQCAGKGAAVHVAIRPEHVRLGPGIEATVKDVVYQGSFKRVAAAPCASPDICLLARLPADADIKENTPISLCIDQSHLILLND
jgi:spermidine/putrescine transport system ATP-binding protein